MKIVLKPGGVILVIVAIVILASLVINNRSANRERTQPTTPSLLKNGGMEGAYITYKARGKTPHGAIISGKIANGWRDESEWSAVTAQYALDTDNPKEGSMCQRITIGSAVQTIPPSDVKSTLQFIQDVDLVQSTKYKFSVWLRADRPTPLRIAIRQSDSPYTMYKEKSVSVTPQWQRFEVTATPPRTQHSYVMVTTEQENVTFWADDAALTVEP